MLGAGGGGGSRGGDACCVGCEGTKDACMLCQRCDVLVMCCCSLSRLSCACLRFARVGGHLQRRHKAARPLAPSPRLGRCSRCASSRSFACREGHGVNKACTTGWNIYEGNEDRRRSAQSRPAGGKAEGSVRARRSRALGRRRRVMRRPSDLRKSAQMKGRQRRGGVSARAPSAPPRPCPPTTASWPNLCRRECNFPLRARGLPRENGPEELATRLV